MNDPRVLVIAAVPIALLFYFATTISHVIVKPRTALQWMTSILASMTGGIACIWFGLRHDVSLREAVASGSLAIACGLVLVMVNRRARAVTSSALD